MRIKRKIRRKVEEKKIDIKPSDRVLEVGSGHDPYARSDVLCDKYVEDDTERGGELETGNRPFHKADIEDLPFEDNEFDFVIASHVVEHVENPSNAIEELQRVAKRGYIECPSYFGELIRPSREYHRWCILPIDGKLVFKHKEDLNFSPFGTLFENGGLKDQSIFLKLFLYQYKNIFLVERRWEEGIGYEIADDGEYEEYFSKPYSIEKIKEIDGVQIEGNFSALLKAASSRVRTKIYHMALKIL
jgi:hypothetical protein